MFLLLYKKLKLTSLLPINDSKELLKQHIEISKTPGITKSLDEEYLYSGTFNNNSFFIRKIYSGGINFFIPFIKGTIDSSKTDTQISLTIRYSTFTITFVCAMILLGIIALIGPKLVQGNEANLNIQGFFVCLSIYFVATLFLNSEINSIKKDLQKYITKP